MADETVTQKLIFDSDQAINALKEVDEAAETVAGKAGLLNKKLQDYSRSLGQSWKQTLKDMQGTIGQMTSTGEKFTGFSLKRTDAEGNVTKMDVTADVLKQTEALARAAQAKNQYVTQDKQATQANMNFDGSVKQVNSSLGEESKRLQVLARELNALKAPSQGRGAGGQFAQTVSFEKQFAGLSSYQEKLRLVETTISNLQKKTNLPVKDIGRELGKSFPTLLKDTNLVSAAVENLTKKNQGLTASFRSEKQVIDEVRLALTKMQAAGQLNTKGMTRQGAVDQLKGVIKEISQATGAQYGQVASEMQKMGVPAAQAQAAVRGLNKELTNGVKEANVFSHGIDIVRTALGTLTAVGIFQFLNFLQQSFSEAVKASRELEDSLFRLGNVEKILSEGGIETSMEGLKRGIKEIKELFPIFSQEDVTQLVAQIAISTKELGLSEQQIIDLSKAIAILNIRSTEEETASQTAQKVISSIITDNAKGISSLGLSFNETAMKAKAMQMGILQAGEAVADLTNEEKAQVKYSIILENTNDELKNLGDYMDTNTAKIKENSASWHDALTAIGSIFTSLTPIMSPFLQAIEDGANGTKALLLIVLSLRDAVISFRNEYLKAIIDITASPVERLERVLNSFNQIPKKMKEGMGERFNNFFPDVPANAPNWFKKIFGDFIEDVDTPTAAIDNLQSALDSIDTSKAQDALRDMLKSLEDLQKKMQEAEQDFQRKLGRFDEDTARERGDLVEDYNLNVLQTQRQFALRRKELEDKYRQKELEDERRFQEQLRQLREKFLYNLEDALRERDARQVLRLIDQYNMEKQALINENALRKQAAEDNRRQELEQLKLEEEERLRVMAEEFAVRMQRFDEESAIKRQRMEEDHAIEMQRLEEQRAEILQKAADKIAEEYNLNAQGAQALYDLLNQYYGSEGALAALTANGYNAMLAQASGFLAQTAAIISQYQGMMASVSGNPYSGGGMGGAYSGNLGMTSQNTYAGGLATGGQFVATKPTDLTVGEGGEPELVTVIPLSKLASMRDNRQPISGVNGMNGRNGQTSIALDLNLSPDLEARVVSRAMDETANVVSRINRSKS